MADAFPAEAVATPTGIGDLRIILRVPAGGEGVNTQGEFLFDVLDQNGERIRSREGDLAPHLTAAEQQSVAAFMDLLLAKARASLPA